MQPLHYDLLCPAAKGNSIAHAAVAPSNLDAAITKRSADTELQIGPRRQRKIISAKIAKIGWQITLADLMQPFQYNLRCPAAKDTSITHAAVAPSNIHAAITMRFATSSSQPASLDAHGNTKRQRSCSHYTAICNQRVKKRIKLRTHEKPLIAEHRGGTNPDRFERSRTRRTHEVPFIPGRSHFTRKNTRFPAPAFPQNEAHVTSPTRISRRTWQHKTTTIMQPLHCDLQPESQETHKNNVHMKNHSLQNTEEEPIRTGSSAAAPAAHTRYLSSPAGSSLHEGFLPRLSPKTKPV